MSYIAVFIAGTFVGFIITCMIALGGYMERNFKNREFIKFNLNEIIITESFKNHPPRAEKMNRKMNYLLKYCDYESPIVINNKNELIDGYTTYLIAKDADIPPKIIKKG